MLSMGLVRERGKMNSNIHNLETVPGLPTVSGIPVPIPVSAPPSNPPMDVYAVLNTLLTQRSITAIVKSRKIEFKCTKFSPLPGDWMECVVDDPMGNESGDELKIVVKGWTPILIYLGPHQLPFTMQ